MRARDLVPLMALSLSVCVLFSVTVVTAEKKTVCFDGQVHSLDFSKAVPGQLNYQGYLADAADSTAVSSTLEMTFRLFDSETKGAELWAETHPTVEVQGGLFQVLLGSVTPFPEGLFDVPELWLQTEVGTEILVPRKPLASVAYSQRSQMADCAIISDEAVFAAEAHHAVLADSATYSPSANLWSLSGDDVYRETGKVGIGTASPLTELDVTGSVNATTYYGDGSNLTGISGSADNDWIISGNHMYSAVPGSVGIGTSSPENKLHVAGDVKATTYYGDGSNLTGISGTTDNDWTISGDTIYHETGNVGIGTTSPTAPLTIEATSGTDVEFTSSGSNVDMVAAAQFNIGTSNIQGLHLMTGGSTRMCLTGAGDMGIGTITPAYKLDVNGSVNATTYYGDGSNLTGISGTTDNDWIISGSNMYSGVSGNVGIGVASPTRKLDVAGEINLNKGISSGIAMFVNGDEALWYNGTYFSWGHGGTANYFADDVGIGKTSPWAMLDVSGDVNTDSLYKIDGYIVLSTPGSNTHVGLNAGKNNPGVYGTCVGNGAGENNTGDDVTLVGFNAGHNNSGFQCISIGYYAGYSNQGTANIFIGNNAGDSNTTGADNIFIGSSTGCNNTTGQENTFLGSSSGISNTTGFYNTFVGAGAGSNALGSRNVFLGYEAGYFETGSDKLYIANGREPSDLLIYGDFSTGRVGIGTTSPSQKLNVDQGNIIVQGTDGFDANGEEAILYLGTVHHYIKSEYGYGVKIGTYAVGDALSITETTGRVGIGTTSPTRKLWVNGDAGGTSAWYNDSDQRLKQDVSTIEGALDKIRNLRGVNFRWRDTENHPKGRQVGLIAQEVAEVVPEVVEKRGEYYSMATANLVPVLVEAMKEQQEIIERLETRIAELEAVVR